MAQDQYLCQSESPDVVPGPLNSEKHWANLMAKLKKDKLKWFNSIQFLSFYLSVFTVSILIYAFIEIHVLP